MRIAIAGSSGMVGRTLTVLAQNAGFEVVAVSRASGVDLRSRVAENVLVGVDTVVDVTDARGGDKAAAGVFFREVAKNLGTAAALAGVRRTLVLSIVGCDRVPVDPYLEAKLAHEIATRHYAPGAAVLRSTQFHEYAVQTLRVARDGQSVRVPDLKVQPVDLASVVALLLELAVGSTAPAPLVEVGGPRREALPDMVARLDGSRTVVPLPVGAAVRSGALLPGPGAVIAGQDFDTWLGRRPQQL